MKSLSSQVQGWLTWFLKGVLVLVFLLLMARLVEVQLIKGKYYRALAEGNRVRKVTIVAPRGQITARGGEVLVSNKIIKKSAGEDEILVEYLRHYSLGSELAHVSGYVGEVSQEEVGKVSAQCPEKGPKKTGSLIGRSGLEEEYDCYLRGIDGEELVEVDIRGKKVRVLGKIEPIPGEDLKTNIDFSLQKKVASVFNGQKGGAVISDTKGQILAFYSSPSFDPADPAAFLKDENLPLFNRIIGGKFHPGSIFKPFVVIAALALGKIDKNYTFIDPGVIKVGIYSYSNWYFSQYGKTEGVVDIPHAIARSVDTFFYKVGEIVGIDKIAQWAEKFGLGKKTGIDLPGEVTGLVPTPEWKKEVKNEAWFLGNTYHVAIGQGDLALTPIALNTAFAAIAANGFLCRPQIAFGNPQCQDLKIKKEDLDLIKEGMIKACSFGGTGYTFFGFQPQVACKTGTAETNEDGKTHAWFTLMAPADFPEIVVTVLVEQGGEGSKVAGPIAREIMNYWQLERNP